MTALAVLVVSYFIAVGFAWYFSGTYLSGLTSVPWVIVGGLVAGWLWSQ